MVNIETDEGVLSLPLQAGDLTYSQYVDITKLVDREQLSKEVITKVILTVIPSVSGIAYTVDGNKLNKWLVSHGRSILSWSDKYISQLRLFSHIMQVVSTYEKEGIRNTLETAFEYKGEVYYLTPDRKQREHLTGLVNKTEKERIAMQILSRWYTAGEVVECKEVMRLNREKIDKEGDPVGEVEYAMNLRLCAILLRLDGEQLPSNKVERDRLIETRMKLFVDLPMDIVLETVFFFLSYISQVDTQPYGKLFFEGKPEVDLLSYGIQVSPTESKAKSKAQRRAEALGKDMYKRIGLQFIYPMCLQNNLYPDFDTIFYSEYSHVIYNLSIKIMYD